MTDMLFDTQKMVERLEGVGVPPAQARMHTVLLAEAISAVETTIIERCASKQDLERLEARVEVRMAGFDARLAGFDARLAELKSELIRLVVTVGVLQTALIAALLLKLTP
jgi:beta-phosphoglucomutase-like phosphatase (HAD superfamily)